MIFIFVSNAPNTFFSIKTQNNSPLPVKEVRDFYLVNLTSWGDKELSTLSSVLSAKASIAKADEHNIYILPKQSNLEFSSKAKKILSDSRLTFVENIEKGRLITMQNPISILAVKNIVPSILDISKEDYVLDVSSFDSWFEKNKPQSLQTIPINDLQAYSISQGLSLDKNQLEKITRYFNNLGRNPTDVELMTYTKISDETESQKIFTQIWQDESGKEKMSISELLRKLPDQNQNVDSRLRFARNKENIYQIEENIPQTTSLTTGFHTGIFVGASHLSQSCARFAGIISSNLHLPNNQRKWEDIDHKTSIPLDTLQQYSLDLANSGIALGVPTLNGFFRTLAEDFSYPVMMSGTMGVEWGNNLKNQSSFDDGDFLVLVGSAASTDSVWEGMRCQEVINSCVGIDKKIILAAATAELGLDMAVFDLLKKSGIGATIDLRNIASFESSMTPLDIWGSGIQTLVVVIARESLEEFSIICERERCPCAVIGLIDKNSTTINLTDKKFKNKPLSLEIDFLSDDRQKIKSYKTNNKIIIKKIPTGTLVESIYDILRFPAVASKRAFITISDRTIGGLLVQDQMVGRFQVPVSDFSIVLDSFLESSGRVMSLGEKLNFSYDCPKLSAKMALGEALTNIAGALVGDIRISVAVSTGENSPENKSRLYDMLEITANLCSELGIGLDINDDKLFTKKNEKDTSKNTAVVMTAISDIRDVNKFATPELSKDSKTILLFIDLGKKAMKMGGSALLQTQNLSSNDTPDFEPKQMKFFLGLMSELHEKNLVLAYHDRSDGGLITTLLEMAFAGKVGLDIDFTEYGEGRDILEAAFNEELGAVLQIQQSDLVEVYAILQKYNLILDIYHIAKTNDSGTINIKKDFTHLASLPLVELSEIWEETSNQIYDLRDNSPTITSELAKHLSSQKIGLTENFNFSVGSSARVLSHKDDKPKVAILREQDSSGHKELGFAFSLAGFEAVDVHMSDLMTGRLTLRDFNVLALGGEGSYGNIFGAGRGWANSILMNSKIQKEFFIFFNRVDTLTLGIGNGCQTLSYIKELVPGASHFYPLSKNTSGRFESQLTQINIAESNSIFFRGMAGSQLAIPVASAEGRFDSIIDDRLVALHYINPENMEKTNSYPTNPTGSIGATAGIINEDGRILLMIPRPDRCLNVSNQSWLPAGKRLSKESCWMQIFHNARDWVQDFLE